MRIRILGRKRFNYSNRRFREEAKRLGVKLSVVDPIDYEIIMGRRSPMLFRKGKKQDEVDLVTSRMGASITSYGLAVLTQFETMGIPVVNHSTSVRRTRDKLHCLQMMSRYDINIPRTVVIRQPSDIAPSVERVGGFPVVVKLLSGTQGVGVMLAENLSSIESTLDTLWSLGQDILLQECVKESLGRDIRVIVLGGEIIGAMRRQARIGKFRSNIHRGGVGLPVRLEPAYERAARQAAKVVELDIAGVDMLESHEGPKVIEVNSSPGLEGVEATTRTNIAGEIMRYFVRVGEERKKVRRMP